MVSAEAGAARAPTKDTQGTQSIQGIYRGERAGKPGSRLRTPSPALRRGRQSTPRTSSREATPKERNRGYLEAAGVGGLETTDELMPARTITFSRSPSSNFDGSSPPSLWNESTASVTSDYQSVADFDMDVDRDNLEATSPPMPLLKADPPKSLGGWTSERYLVYIQRASLCQRFGVAFEAIETLDRRLGAVNVAEDLPHLGICRGDQVVTLNNRTPTSVKECRAILEQAKAIHVVLQRGQPDRWASRPAGKAPGGILLSVTKATIIDGKLGDFRLTMHRSSQRQRFGIVFEHFPPRRRGEELVIRIADDMPHVGMMRGDRLIAMNGVHIRNKRTCSQIMGTAMSLKLYLRREYGSLSSLAHEVDPMDDDSEVEYEASTSILGCFNCVQEPHKKRAVTKVQSPRTKVPELNIPERKVVGHDAMGGAIDTDTGDQDYFTLCNAPRQVDYENVAGKKTYPLVEAEHYSRFP